MTTPDETTREYYTRRAREERVMAVTANDNSAAIAHLQMAERYEAQASALALAADAAMGE